MVNKAYCIGCKDITYAIKVSIDYDEKIRYNIAKGICPVCGTETRRIISKE